jgi:HEPN domain-containing protein
MPVNAEVAAWVNKAEEDFEIARTLRYKRRRQTPSGVCFHCQQCAEKYLKAFVVSHKMEFPWIHDLTPLLNRCLTVNPWLEVLRADLRLLNQYSVTVRYPGEEPTVDEAKEAFAAVKRVREVMRKTLNLR